MYIINKVFFQYFNTEVCTQTHGGMSQFDKRVHSWKKQTIRLINNIPYKIYLSILKQYFYNLIDFIKEH